MSLSGLSPSLQAFQSDLSNSMNQLVMTFESGSEILSLSWIQQCFQLIPIIHKAFTKLVVDIDYPTSKWSDKSMEEYLNYSLSLMDLLNSMSSSLSHLGRARLSLFHSLSIMDTSPSYAIKHLKATKFEGSTKDLQYPKSKKDEEGKSYSGKERTVYQALIDLRSIGFWVCGVVLAGLCGDAKAYLEMRKSAIMISNSSLINLDSRIYRVIMEKGVVLKDIEELNRLAAGLAAATANGKLSNEAQEMQRRLGEFERLRDGLKQEVDRLFSDVLAARNELIDKIRIGKQ